MKFFKLNSKVQVNVAVTKYICDWDHVVSKPQKLVKDFLRPYWAAHVVLEEFRIPGGLSRIDLCNITRRIVVEVSPRSSHSFNQFFHKNRVKFGAAVMRDLNKEIWAKQNGFQFVEITEDDFPKLSAKWFEEIFKIVL